MPNSATVTFATAAAPGAAEADARPVTVSFPDMPGGGAVENARVERFTACTGPVPSEATVLLKAGPDVPPLQWLTASYPPGKLPWWSLVELAAGASGVVWRGYLWRWHGNGRGEITLTFVDARYLLARMPLHGAWLVAAAGTEEQFIPGYYPHFNPGGYVNMTYVSLTAREDNVPLFTRQGIVSGRTDGDLDAAGTARIQQSPWTPEAMIQYLEFAGNVSPIIWSTHDARYVKFPRGFSLDAQDCKFHSAANSRMAQPAPKADVRGTQWLETCQAALDIGGGEYAFGVEHGETTTQGKFFPQTKALAGDDVLDLTVLLAGARNREAPYDLIADAEAPEATEVLCEGHLKQVETSLTYDPDSLGTNTLVPMDTDTEFADWKAYIVANRGSTVATQNDAISKARQKYPRACICFKVVGRTDEGDLATLLGRFSTLCDHVKPFDRGIAKAQLQRIFAGRDQRYAVRVEVRVDGTWRDATPANGLEVDDDGGIYLTGLTDELATAPDRVYNGSLRTDIANAITRRAVRINCALNDDERVSGFRRLVDEDPNGIRAEVDTNMHPQHYVLAPDAWRHERQVASAPAPDVTATDVTLADDSSAAEDHAARLLSEKARVKRRLVLPFAGLRFDLTAGRFIRNLTLSGGAGGVLSVNAPITHVEYDVAGQTTKVTIGS
jgi:hypothetical protein